MNFDIGVVMFTGYDEDGHPVLQPDLLGGAESGTEAMWQHHAFGFWGMPDEPGLDPDGTLDPREGAQCLHAWEGSLGHILALEDTRFALKLPRLKKRGSVQYGGRRARPTFSMIDGDSGSFQLYVPYAFTGEGDAAVPSKACTLGVNVRTPGAESFEMVHGDGMAITMAGGNVTLRNADGTVCLVVSGSKVTINGDLQVNGSIQFGGPTGVLPVMLSNLQPAAMLTGL